MLLRFFILILFVTPFCNAQNLVYNGSFEEITQCNSQKHLYYDYVVGWVNPCQLNGHTSDYFNTTCPFIPGFDKIPYDGNGLFGLATYSSTQTYPSGITNFHEFVRGTLTTPLTIGKTYCVSFKVASLTPTFSSNNIGALFTNVPYKDTNPFEALPNRAHVFSSTVITDTNWTTVSGSFVADSAYHYIMLGNFFADNLTSHISGGAYYWIDDVHVVLDPNGNCSALSAPDTTYHVTQNISICPNETMTLPNGTIVNTNGTYIDTLKTINGADSIITTTLNILPYSTDTLNVSICHGSQYSFGGNLLTTSGVYTDTLTTASTSCDSVIVLNLNVLSVIPPTNISATICVGSVYNFGGNLLTTSGIYSDTLTTVSTSCDSIIVLNLNVLSVVPSTSISATICAGSTYNFGGNLLTTSGIYSDTLTTVSTSCDSIIVLNLLVTTLPSKPEIKTNLPIPCYDQEFIGEIVNPNATFTYQWYDDTNNTAIGQGEKITKIIDENAPTIYVTADNGMCHSTFTFIPITINQLFNANFEMPNVITPNNDGINDEIDFEIIFGDCMDYEITILNRWGNPVFTQGKIFNGKDSKGRNLIDGTYFYILTYNGIKRHGFIQVLR